MGDRPGLFDSTHSAHAYSADTVVAMSVAYLSFLVLLMNGYSVE